MKMLSGVNSIRESLNDDKSVDWRRADKGFIFTVSGKRIRFIDTTNNEYDILDICHGVSNNLRWNGNTTIPWTVAQHCLLVSDLINDLKWDTPLKNKEIAVVKGLTHDFTEAYLGDLATPIKRELELYKSVEDRLDSDIDKLLDIEDKVTDEVIKLVKRADTLSLHLEAKLIVDIDKDYERYVDDELERSYSDVKGSQLVNKYRERFKIENKQYVCGKLLCKLYMELKRNYISTKCFDGIPDRVLTQDGMTPIYVGGKICFRVYDMGNYINIKREYDKRSFNISKKLFNNIVDIRSIEESLYEGDL